MGSLAHGIWPASLYKLNSKLGRIEVSEVKLIRILRDENAKQIKLLTEAILDTTV